MPGLHAAPVVEDPVRRIALAQHRLDRHRRLSAPRAVAEQQHLFRLGAVPFLVGPAGAADLVQALRHLGVTPGATCMGWMQNGGHLREVLA
mgnify:CR=1 FL=1